MENKELTPLEQYLLENRGELDRVEEVNVDGIWEKLEEGLERLEGNGKGEGIVGGQESGVRGQELGIRSQGAGIRGQGRRFSMIVRRRSMIVNHLLGISALAGTGGGELPPQLRWRWVYFFYCQNNRSRQWQIRLVNYCRR